MKLKQFATIMVSACAMLFATASVQAFYSPGTGRWLSRDPIGEDGGPNIYAFVVNAPQGFIDALGLEWVIDRKWAARANARAQNGDTFRSLAEKLHLDFSDIKLWCPNCTNPDESPDPCKDYSVPNTIIYEYGYYHIYTGIISYWRWLAKSEQAELLKKGFNVISVDPTTSTKMVADMKSRDLYGMIYIGHGDEDATATIDMGEADFLQPNRYTTYGIAFLYLRACESADTITPKRGWTYNAWEYNVAKNGIFTGYYGEVDMINEVWHFRITHGKNRR